jgi:hypothetical protein
MIGWRQLNAVLEPILAVFKPILAAFWPNIAIATYRRGLVPFCCGSEQAYGQPFDPEAIIPCDVAKWKARQQAVENVLSVTVNARLTALSCTFIGRWLIASVAMTLPPVSETSTARYPSPKPSKTLHEIAIFESPKSPQKLFEGL